jgi:signal peptide peptidase SppA
MYKKLLNQENKNFGGVNNFVASLRKEITFWKIAFLLSSAFIIFIYATNKVSQGKKSNQNPLSQFSKNIEVVTTSKVKDLKEDIIAEIKIEGPIFSHQTMDKLLNEVYKSEKIKGLIITINSPGGDPTSSEVIYTRIKKISKKIPVISFIEGAAASGGYMIAIAAPKIISVKTGAVGSIGVISSQFDYTELMKKIGINYLEFATSPYKGAGNPYKKPTQTEIEYRQDLINQIFEVFKEFVKEERKLTNSQLQKISNAKVFIGVNAIPVKLIDAIGDKDFVINEIKSQLKEKEVKNAEEIKLQELKTEESRESNFLIKTYLSSFLLKIKSLIIK